MNKLTVIGHRGVRRLKTENTISALSLAQEFDVDAVEFDVRQTRDGQLVLCHNRNLLRIYGLDRNVDELSLAELRRLKSDLGDQIPTLAEVVRAGIKVPLLLDVKNRGSAEAIYKTMSGSGANWMVTTFLYSEAVRFKQLDPDLFVSVATFIRPFKAIRHAEAIHANALTFNLLMLNPLTYLLARHKKLQILLYQNYLSFLLSSPFCVRLIAKVYPGVGFCTDRPDKIVGLFKS